MLLNKDKVKRSREHKPHYNTLTMSCDQVSFRGKKTALVSVTVIATDDVMSTSQFYSHNKSDSAIRSDEKTATYLLREELQPVLRNSCCPPL